MAEPLTRTPEGWEHQFATNHLGHFGLATGLHASLAAASGARIVSLSSTGHFYSPIVFDDIQFETREYDPWQGYGQSKTANVLFAVEATRRWADDGITANAVMPGGIRTELQRYVKDQPGWAEIDANYQWKTTEQGAATSILLAVSPLLDGVGGRYFEDCNESGIIDPAEGISTQHGVAAWAVDPAAATRLWDVSVALLGELRARLHRYWNGRLAHGCHRRGIAVTRCQGRDLGLCSPGETLSGEASPRMSPYRFGG